MRRPFDIDPVTGKTETFEFDGAADTFTIHTAQDIEPLLEHSLRSRNRAENRWGGDVHRVASLPLAVYQDLATRGIIGDEKAFRKWLNSPEAEVFRTRRGKV